MQLFDNVLLRGVFLCGWEVPEHGRGLQFCMVALLMDRTAN
jgi:hypothetical protein